MERVSGEISGEAFGVAPEDGEMNGGTFEVAPEGRVRKIGEHTQKTITLIDDIEELVEENRVREAAEAVADARAEAISEARGE